MREGREDCHRVSRARGKGPALHSERVGGVSIGGFVGFGSPSAEDGDGFFAEELVHGNAAFVMRDGNFAVDEGVVETCGSGIGGSGGVEDLRWTSPINCAETHGAGFAGGEEFAVIELKGFEALAGFANRNDFGVGSGVVGSGNTISTCGDEGAAFGDDGSERAAAVADVFKSERDGLAHEVECHG